MSGGESSSESEALLSQSPGISLTEAWPVPKLVGPELLWGQKGLSPRTALTFEGETALTSARSSASHPTHVCRSQRRPGKR